MELVASKLVFKVKRKQPGAPEPRKFLGHGKCIDVNRSCSLSTHTDQMDTILKVTEQLWTTMKIPPCDVRGLGILMQHTKLASAGEAEPNQLARMWASTTDNITHHQQANTAAHPQNQTKPNQETNNTWKQAVNPSSFSQVDEHVLNQLPPDVQREIRMKYGVPKKAASGGKPPGTKRSHHKVTENPQQAKKQAARNRNKQQRLDSMTCVKAKTKQAGQPQPEHSDSAGCERGEENEQPVDQTCVVVATPHEATPVHLLPWHTKHRKQLVKLLHDWDMESVVTELRYLRRECSSEPSASDKFNELLREVEAELAIFIGGPAVLKVEML
eukprot:TRINITY_DN5232_c0_g1_i1.p1 TRINITY_DN5232_c0_g1~~TRINITY_DN5232_c0_g1_i1.p1  ORF type:complete len:361 (+),score=45.30 TRINITY_DN5232_c0_g1_i1:100-1083(+)